MGFPICGQCCPTCRMFVFICVIFFWIPEVGHAMRTSRLALFGKVGVCPSCRGGCLVQPVSFPLFDVACGGLIVVGGRMVDGLLQISCRTCVWPSCSIFLEF